MPEQNYATHVHRPTGWVVAWFGALLVTALFVWDAARAPTLQSIALVLLGAVVLLAVTLVRAYALRLQDRIIRLEMRVRLGRLGREQALERLSVKQIVALRFAADAELPALVDRAVAENLPPDEIKRAVTDWQGDFLRT
jgi:hypothetical protein